MGRSFLRTFLWPRGSWVRQHPRVRQRSSLPTESSWPDISSGSLNCLQKPGSVSQLSQTSALPNEMSTSADRWCERKLWSSLLPSQAKGQQPRDQQVGYHWAEHRRTQTGTQVSHHYHCNLSSKIALQPPVSPFPWWIQQKLSWPCLSVDENPSFVTCFDDLWKHLLLVRWVLLYHFCPV